MANLMALIKTMFKTYSAKELALSIVTGFFFAILITVPFFAAWINLLLIYIRQLYLYLFLINLTASVFLFLWVKFAYETLTHYQKQEPVKLTKLMLIEGLSVALLSFIIGTIVILTVTPNLL